MTLLETIKRLLGRPSTNAPSRTSMAGTDDASPPPPRSGLDPSDQATIDAARGRNRTFVRDAAVELETAPDDVPADAQAPVDQNPDADAPREAKRARFHE